MDTLDASRLGIAGRPSDEERTSVSLAVLRASPEEGGDETQGNVGSPRRLDVDAERVFSSRNERGELKEVMGTILADESLTRVVVAAGGGDPDAFLAAVLARLMAIERLDLEIGYVTHTTTPATENYSLPVGEQAAAFAVSAPAVSTPLIRDDTGAALVGIGHHRGRDGHKLEGEGIVDDTRLFAGETAGVTVRPTPQAPGVRASLDRRWRRRWVAGRAAQTGGPAIVVVRDGVVAPKTVRRSTFYRHHDDWKLVRP